MKKFTLALAMGALALSASAINKDTGYAIVAADASTRGGVYFLTINSKNQLEYVSELSDATQWVWSSTDSSLKNQDKYVRLGEAGYYIQSTPDPVNIANSKTLSGACTISCADTPTYYLDTELDTYPTDDLPENINFYFYKLTASTTTADLVAKYWAATYPDAMVIAVGGSTARPHGKYMSVTDEGRLITSNVLNGNALWNREINEETGEEYISNIGVEGYLYTGSGSRNITLSKTPQPLKIEKSNVLPTGYGITTNLEADQQSDYGWLNALNTRNETEDGGIGTWNLDQGSSFFFLAYDGTQTPEEIDDKVQNLYTVGTQISNAITTANLYINSSWAGREYGESLIVDIENAETTDELNAAILAAKQGAVSYAERSLKYGSVIVNKRKNQPLAYVAAEAETRPFQRVAQTDYSCLFKAIAVEGAEPTVIDDITFNTYYLQNVSSGKYLSKNETSSTAHYDAGALVATDDTEQAAQIRLVMGNNGFEILVTNDGKERSYLNVSDNGEDSKLCCNWRYDNDGGAFWTLAELPAFAPDQTIAIGFDGTKVEDKAETFTTISSLKVCVPVGAEATGIAGLSFYSQEYDEQWNLNKIEIQIWTADDLKAITPEAGSVSIRKFDVSTMSFTDQTFEGMVYTLPLTAPLTNANNCAATLGQYAFSLTADGAIAYSRATVANCTVESQVGIREIPASAEARAYDLQGRRVAATARGIIIVNGKKTIR